MRALFLTWDGLQQNYLESLFFPIFARLRPLGVNVEVLQFTWAGDAELAVTRRAADRFGVPYSASKTSRRFGVLGSVAALGQAARQIVGLVRERRIDVLFPRSLMPASMVLLARRYLPQLPVVFDADGLMADERVDFAGWDRSGAPYRVLREVEAQTARIAASVIVRTQGARDILLARAGAQTSSEKIFVIPNAKDASLFSPGSRESRARARASFGVGSDAPWLVYTGSIGPQYQLDGMLGLFAAVARRLPGSRFHLFTFDEERVRRAVSEQGLAGAVQVTRGDQGEVAAALSAADLGLALRTDTFSQRAVSPIKVAEYLLSGVPVVTTRVGDLAAQLGGLPVAHFVPSGEPNGLEKAADWFQGTVLADREGVRTTAREVGARLFSLDSCAYAYGAAFHHAVGRDGCSSSHVPFGVTSVARPKEES